MGIEMKYINREAVIIKPKQPFLDWVNSDPKAKEKLTLKDISQENSILLIPEFDYEEDSINYIKERYSYIFEFELEGWMVNKKLWPQNRTWQMFQEWFDVQINSEVFDLVEEDIEKEEM